MLTRCGISLTVWLLLMAAHANSQDSADLPQAWIGTLDVKVAKLRLRFDIEKDDQGKLKCTLTSIDQGNSKTQMDSCEIKDGKLRVTNKTLMVVFEGTYDNANQQIRGTFTQAGQSFELELAAAEPPKPRKHIETWLGTMKAGQRSFEFQFRVLEDADKVRTVELDSLSEGLAGLAVDANFSGNSVSFKVPLSNAEFKGQFNKEKTEIIGQWLQGGRAFPLTVKKVALSATKTVAPPKRP